MNNNNNFINKLSKIPFHYLSLSRYNVDRSLVAQSISLTRVWHQAEACSKQRNTRAKMGQQSHYTYSRTLHKLVYMANSTSHQCIVERRWHTLPFRPVAQGQSNSWWLSSLVCKIERRTSNVWNGCSCCKASGKSSYTQRHCSH